MMKKLVFLLSLSFASYAFALSNGEIVAFYEAIFKTQMPNAKVSVGKRQKLDDGFESVELNVKVKDMQSTEILFIKDNFIFPDVIDVKKKISFRQEFEMKQYYESKLNFEKNVKAALKTETKIIAIGDSKKPKIYVFSDPECPYCRQHLAKLETELQKYQINFILTTIHGENAFHKVAQIYTEMKEAKTNTQKIAILRKYYDERVKTPKATKKAYDEAVALYQKYAKLGLRSVPSFIE